MVPSHRTRLSRVARGARGRTCGCGRCRSVNYVACGRRGTRGACIYTLFNKAKYIYRKLHPNKLHPLHKEVRSARLARKCEVPVSRLLRRVCGGEERRAGRGGVIRFRSASACCVAVHLRATRGYTVFRVRGRIVIISVFLWGGIKNTATVAVTAIEKVKLQTTLPEEAAARSSEPTYSRHPLLDGLRCISTGGGDFPGQ